MPKLDTSIDRMVEFIKLRKSCTVEEAAKSLGLPSKQVEELAEILAESGIIDVRYEFSGIRLFPKMVRKDEKEEKAKVERKLTAVERVESIRREFLDAENMFVFSEKDVRRKIENAKMHFREIEKMDLSQENMELLRSKMDELESSIRAFEENIGAFEKAALDARKEVDAFKEQADAHSGKSGRLRLSLGKFLTKVKSVFRRRKAAKPDVAEKPAPSDQIQVGG